MEDEQDGPTAPQRYAGALRAEWGKLLRRPAVAALFLGCLPGIVLVRYWLGYSQNRQARLIDDGGPPAWALETLLPQGLVQTVIDDVPMVGAAGVVVGAALLVAAERDFGTLKVILVQGPRRAEVLGAKATALFALVAAALAAAFAAAAAASTAIAVVEGEPLAYPPATLLMTAFGYGLLILSAWAAVGFLFAVLARNSGMAIGLALGFQFAVEGPIAILAQESSAFAELSKLLIWPHAGTLIVSLRPNTVFGGAQIPVWQAVVSLAVYAVLALTASVIYLRQHDVN